MRQLGKLEDFGNLLQFGRVNKRTDTFAFRSLKSTDFRLLLPKRKYPNYRLL